MNFFVEIIVSFLIALIVSNFFEWFVHRYVLHGLGKKKNSFFHHHWKHHLISRKNAFTDLDYKNIWNKNSLKEILSLIVSVLFNITYLFVWPMLFCWFCFFAILYYILHRYSHLNPEWTKKWMPWHYDHHMYDQNNNWCVTLPIFDYILKTRSKPNK